MGLVRPSRRALMQAAAHVAFSLCWTWPAAAQTGITVSGRIIDGSSGADVVGAHILVGAARAISGEAGQFSVAKVPVGDYLLLVRAFGYRTLEQRLTLRADTTLSIRLEVAPFRLDTIAVTSEPVTLAGVVRDAQTDQVLVDVDVTAGGGATTRSGNRGTFDIELPGATFTQVRLTAFGYLPLLAEIDATRDTTVHFAMEPDQVVLRMIERQIGRLSVRAAPLRTVGKSAIDRNDLESWNGTLLALLENRGFTRRVKCVLIDDVQTTDSELLARLDAIVPDRVERVELLERGQMLRVYTRDYIRRMVAGGVELKPPVFVAASPPYCR